MYFVRKFRGYDPFSDGASASSGAVDMPWLIPTSVKTANYTLTAGSLALFDLITAGANLTAKLPPASVNAFCGVKIKGYSNGWKLAVDKNGADRIDGYLTTFNLECDDEAVFFESNGVDWYRVGNEIPLQSIQPEIAPLRFSPLGLYAMNGASDTADSSGNARTLVAGVASTDGQSPVLGKLSYQIGTASVLDAAFNVTGAISVGGIVQSSSPNTKSCLMMGGSTINVAATQANNVTWSLGVVNQRIYWEQESGARVNAILNSGASGTQISSTRFHHIAGTRDATGTAIKLYIDGRLMASGSLTAPNGGTASPGLWVGIRQNNTSWPAPSYIAGCWVIPSTLTDAQILYMARKQLGLSK